MADGWNHLNDELLRRKTSTMRRRQLELLVRSNNIRDMYHNVLESIITLYKDDRQDLHTWHQFRAAADKLTEMHRFMKLTIAKIYELGTVEGASAYYWEFFDKLKELRRDSDGQNISFEYLRDYLSQPDDPPLRPPHRTKRLAVRRRSVNTFFDSCTTNLSTSSVAKYPTPQGDAPRGDNTELEFALSKKPRLHPSSASLSAIDSSSSSCTESESFTDDSGGSSSCSCDDCLTDCSTSANDDDESDSRYEPCDSHFPNDLHTPQ